MDTHLIAPYKAIYFDEIDSTNDEVRRRVEMGADNGLWVVAKHQTNGRGRRGREWISEQGNFFGSLFLETDIEPKRWSELSFVAALAVHDLLVGLSAGKGVVGLKWPNDVLYNGKKVSGILLESGSGNILGGIILGIGINLAHAPQTPDYATTSLAAESGFHFLPSEVLPRLVEIFDEYYTIWKTNGFKDIKDNWLKKTTSLNKLVKVQLIDATFEGVFLGLSDEGGARIELDDGTERIVLAGDIFPLA